MIKTLQNTLKQDKERFTVPKSVQDIIPIRRIWPDGVFQFGSKYSKTLRFSDINYAIASKEDKTAMFLSYSELLNALDTSSTTKITINNKRLDRRNFEQEILIPPKGDDLDGGRKEYNAMLLDKVTDSSNSVVQERYITLSVHKKNVEEARAFFDRTVHDASSRLNHMDSHCEEMDAADRLHILHDFYRVGEESEFRFDLRENMKNGRSFKDAICPDSMEFKKDHFIMGGKYGRVLFLKEYASYIKDSMINELTSLNRSLMLSIDIIPVPTDEAVREMQNRLLGVETNVTNWQRRQNANNNFSAVVPYDLEQQRKETREMLDDLTTRDQRMMFAVVTLVHLADSKEELDSDTETLQSIARKHLCQLTTLNWQQADGLVTALPLGLRRIDALRTLTTEALAVLMPFKAQEIWDRGGVYYGQNAISKNLIVADRKRLLNGNAFILGVSGSGKSTLVNQILYPVLADKLNGARIVPGKHTRVEGVDQCDKVIHVDQNPIGRTPRSNPATYTGVWDKIRTLFAKTPEAQVRGYGPGRFSFNVKGGRCEACHGDGTLKIEMNFLPDVYVDCEECHGKRYNRETLEVKYNGKSVADVLDMPIEEAAQFFKAYPSISRYLDTLVQVGLGYIRLGQPAPTLSGGESQRVKLATELQRRSTGKTVYILDEPTTGLHFEDVRKLLLVLQGLVDKGNTVIVIEHNLDVVKSADWLIDLGPEGGDGGGTIVTEGTPEQVAQCERSWTGKFLKDML